MFFGEKWSRQQIFKCRPAEKCPGILLSARFVKPYGATVFWLASLFDCARQWCCVHGRQPAARELLAPSRRIIFPTGPQTQTKKSAWIISSSVEGHQGSAVSWNRAWLETGALLWWAVCVKKNWQVGTMACAACQCFEPNAVSRHRASFVPAEALTYALWPTR